MAATATIPVRRKRAGNAHASASAAHRQAPPVALPLVQLSKFKPKTALGRRLVALRAQMAADGEKFLSADEILADVAAMRR